MLTFRYEARNAKTGESVKAQVQAENQQSALKVIREKGLTPLKVELEKSSLGGRFRRIKTKDRVLFSRQLSTLLNAGLPLVQSLRSVAKQTSNKQFQALINTIITDVEGGYSFSKALAKNPNVFNRVFVSLVEASEVSGTLDSGLERLADQQEKDADIVSKVRGAMTYPLIVLLVMMVVVGFMVVKVLPQVENIYAGIKGASLPFLTTSLLALSHAITDYLLIVLVVVAVLIFFVRRWTKTSSGRSALDLAKMKAWPIGPLFMKMYMARFARTGTTLASSGVPILQVLEITADAVDNVHISKSIRAAIVKVKSGKSLAQAIENDPNFLELVPNMLSIGEQSGSIETMFGKIAEYYEKEVDNEIKSVSTIIEPVMMVVMGIIAITIVAAVLLPIYGLVSNSGFSG